MLDDLLEAWRTNNRINLLLLDKISAAGLKCSLSKRGGRDVARQFGHLHTNRVWQLEKRARDLAQGLVKFEGKLSPGKPALKASGLAIEKFLKGVLAQEQGRRGFKKGVCTTLAYFVAHDSHHRGNILLTLKECGHSLPRDISYGIWGWDQI